MSKSLDALIKMINFLLEKDGNVCAFCLRGDCKRCNKSPVGECKNHSCKNPFCIGKRHGLFQYDPEEMQKIYIDAVIDIERMMQRYPFNWQREKCSRLLAVLDQWRRMLPAICEMNPGKHPGYILRYWLVSLFGYGKRHCVKGANCSNPNCCYCIPVCEKGFCSFNKYRFWVQSDKKGYHQIWAEMVLGEIRFGRHYASLEEECVVPIQRCWRNYLLRKKQRELDRMIACQKRKREEREANIPSNSLFPSGFIIKQSGLLVSCYCHEIPWYCLESEFGGPNGDY